MTGFTPKRSGFTRYGDGSASKCKFMTRKDLLWMGKIVLFWLKEPEIGLGKVIKLQNLFLVIELHITDLTKCHERPP